MLVVLRNHSLLVPFYWLTVNVWYMGYRHLSLICPHFHRECPTNVLNKFNVLPLVLFIVRCLIPCCNIHQSWYALWVNTQYIDPKVRSCSHVSCIHVMVVRVEWGGGGGAPLKTCSLIIWKRTFISTLKYSRQIQEFNSRRTTVTCFWFLCFIKKLRDGNLL